MNKKNTRGGARPGSGRKKKNTSIYSIMLSSQADGILNEYAAYFKDPRSEIINNLIVMYLDSSNKDILLCEKCKKPMMFSFLLPAIDSTGYIDCPSCGHKNKIYR